LSAQRATAKFDRLSLDATRKVDVTFDLKEIIVAADIGGTQMRAALVRGDGEILFRRELPTPHNVNVPNELTDLISSVAHHVPIGEQAASRVVIGLPGAVDYHAERLLWAPHLPESWPEQLSESQLQAAIGLPVQIANDADVAALGEAYFGSGRDFRDVAYITISTGIGAGFVYGGRLLRGNRSLGELGHTVIDWTAWLAHRPATLEELASGTGLTRMATEIGLSALSGQKINELVQSGDTDALEIWGRAIAAAAVGVTNLTMAFSPEVVVIGGGLGLQPNFFAALQETFSRNFPPQMSPTPLVLAALGDNAGLIGTTRWTASND